MLSTIFDRIMKAIDDTKAAPALRSELELLKSTIDNIERENTGLKAEIDRLKEIKQKYNKQNELVDLGHVKIKLGTDGKWNGVYYCPKCGGILTTPDTVSPIMKQRLTLLGIAKCCSCDYAVRLELLNKSLADWNTRNSNIK